MLTCFSHWHGFGPFLTGFSGKSLKILPYWKTSILVYKVTHTAKKYELLKPVDLVVNKLILFPTARWFYSLPERMILTFHNKNTITQAFPDIMVTKPLTWWLITIHSVFSYAILPFCPLNTGSDESLWGVWNLKNLCIVRKIWIKAN